MIHNEQDDDYYTTYVFPSWNEKENLRENDNLFLREGEKICNTKQSKDLNTDSVYAWLLHQNIKQLGDNNSTYLQRRFDRCIYQIPLYHPAQWLKIAK